MPFKLRSWLRVLGLGALAVSVAVMSADHAESPGADADPAGDLADVFIFPSPEPAFAATRMVGAITFGGRPLPRSRIDQNFYCDPRVLYAFNIDRADGAGAFDNLPDIVIFARFSINSSGGCVLQLQNVPGAGGTISGTTETVITAAGGLRAFAGLRNDPFFFDAQGYQALVTSFGAGPPQSGDVVTSFGLGARPRIDSFANRNVSAIVFEMDTNVVAPLAGGVRPSIRVWSTTARRVN